MTKIKKNRNRSIILLDIFMLFCLYFLFWLKNYNFNFFYLKHEMLHVISVIQWSSNLIIIAHTYSSFFNLLCRQTFYYLRHMWCRISDFNKTISKRRLLCCETKFLSEASNCDVQKVKFVYKAIGRTFSRICLQLFNKKKQIPTQETLTCLFF